MFSAPFCVVGACLAIMLALPLTGVAAFAMAEAPFILFITLALVLTAKFLDTGRRSDLVWAAVFASLAMMTRYIGITVAITVLPLLLLQRGVSPGEKAKRIGLYLLITALPVALWLLQNFLLYGKTSRDPKAVAVEFDGDSGQGISATWPRGYSSTCRRGMSSLRPRYSPESSC